MTAQIINIKESAEIPEEACSFCEKPFAGEENKCQDTNKVPFPLPKVGK